MQIQMYVEHDVAEFVSSSFVSNYQNAKNDLSLYVRMNKLVSSLTASTGWSFRNRIILS